MSEAAAPSADEQLDRVIADLRGGVSDFAWVVDRAALVTDERAWRRLYLCEPPPGLSEAEIARFEAMELRRLREPPSERRHGPHHQPHESRRRRRTTARFGF